MIYAHAIFRRLPSFIQRQPAASETKSFLTSKDFRSSDVPSAIGRQIGFRFCLIFFSSVYSQNAEAALNTRVGGGPILESRCDDRSYITIATARLHTRSPKLPSLIVPSISGGGGWPRPSPAEASQPVTGLPTRRYV